MIHAKLESIKVLVKENDSVLNVAVGPILISNGNVQLPGIKEAASIRLQEFDVTQRIKKLASSPKLRKH